MWEILFKKDALKRHYFTTHSGYKGELCPYCNKKIFRINNHIKLCYFKHKNKNLFRTKLTIKKLSYK